MDAIHRALELGINWIDTAGVYGLGHSEEVVARALRDVAERPLVFTKCGMVWHDQPDGVPRPNLRPEEIRRGCDDSLRRLGVERIDLFQFHWPDANTGTPVEESWGVMADLVAAGKVRWAGVSNFDVALLERCEPIHHVDSLQPPFNAIDRAAAADLLPWCAAHGTGVIVYSPMMSGLLTGRFSHERAAALDEADWRREFPPFVEPALSRNLALARRAAPGRRAPRHLGRRGRGGLDADLAGRERGDRRRSLARAGGRLDRRRRHRAERRRPRGDRRRHHHDRGRRRAGESRRLTSPPASPPTTSVARGNCSTPSSPARRSDSRSWIGRCATSA